MLHLLVQMAGSLVSVQRPVVCFLQSIKTHKSHGSDLMVTSKGGKRNAMFHCCHVVFQSHEES